MPVIIASNIGFEASKGYYIDLYWLAETFPHIRKDKETEIYLIELKNEQDKLVKRFKPFKKLQLKTGTYFQEATRKWIPCILIPEDIASQFNIGRNYKLTIMVTKYDGRAFLPLEIKGVGYDVQKALELFSRIEVNLLSLSLEHPTLNKCVSYLWDSYTRLEDGDIDGARTALRNSLDILKNEFLPKITIPETSEETHELPQKLKGLIRSIMDFLHYGGPHPRPAPKTTTEMILSMTIELLRYLSRAMESKLIELHEGERL